MLNADHKLDNPVWNSLLEAHKHFAIDYGAVKFYHPDYCPFGACTDCTGSIESIDTYAALAGNFFLVGEKPLLPDRLTIQQDLVCLQMVVSEKINMEINESIVPLTEEHTDILYELVTLVQPGYFKKKTVLLGSYFGIFKEDELVAVTGERMKMHDFVEISAVVTHPDYTGKGYAKQLVAHAVNNVLDQNKTPYLHVTETNTGAIRLYEKLGFKTRRKISFWHVS